MQPQRLTLVHLIVLICLFVFAFSTNSAIGTGDNLLRIYFLNVGQGDAEFISINGNQVLIDGGPDNTVISELAKVMPFHDHSIDLVVATHPHSDHISGLIDVLNRYDVAQVLQAKESYNSPQFEAWRQAVANEHTDEEEAMAGKVIDLGGGATLTVLHPFRSVTGTITKTPHDDIVVVLLEYGNFKALFTGDMETSVEKELVRHLSDRLGADVLKIGHHGSKTSSSPQFLTAVSPQAAFIEVGKKNPYHHPALAVLARLESYGIRYYRTDTEGTIEVISDGEKFQIIK